MLHLTFITSSEAVLKFQGITPNFLILKKMDLNQEQFASYGISQQPRSSFQSEAKEIFGEGPTQVKQQTCPDWVELGLPTQCFPILP